MLSTTLTYNCLPVGIISGGWTYQPSFPLVANTPCDDNGMKKKSTQMLVYALLVNFSESNFGDNIPISTTCRFVKAGYFPAKPLFCITFISFFAASRVETSKRCFEQFQISCWLLIKSTVKGKCYYGILASVLSLSQITFDHFQLTQKTLIYDGVRDNRFSTQNCLY